MLRENINAMRKEDEIKVKRNTLVEKGRANRDPANRNIIHF